MCVCIYVFYSQIAFTFNTLGAYMFLRMSVYNVQMYQVDLKSVTVDNQ